MLNFNLSIDFELGWGELARLADDDRFHARVAAGLAHTPDILAVLTRAAVPSTWGVVGACCADSLEELQLQAPEAYRAVEPQLMALQRRRPAYRKALFCPELVRTIHGSAGVELASHGFLHLLPTGLTTTVLRSDIAASVARLRDIAGRVESFIPPQNYHWPDAALAGTGILYVRHTPRVCGVAYSDSRRAAKFARLWNDLVSPVSYSDSRNPPVWLLFLRVDRGARIWARQLGLIRRLLRLRAGSLYCFSHPHNLDSASRVQRFSQLCAIVSEAASAGKLTFGRFHRRVPERLQASG